jgi:hypothetical protein
MGGINIQNRGIYKSIMASLLENTSKDLFGTDRSLKPPYVVFPERSEVGNRLCTVTSKPPSL